MRLKTCFDSVAFRISISIALVIVASMIAAGWLILREEEKILEEELRNKGRYLATIISHQVVEPLLYEERHDVYSLLKASMIHKDSLIVYAEVYDKSGETVVKAFKDERFSTIQLPPYDFENPADDVDIREDSNMLIYYISLPITVETYGTIGFLRMCITKEFLNLTLESVKKKLYLLAAVVTFVGIILGLYMARKILNPVLILNKGVQRIGEGEVGVEVPVVGHGEIRELSLSFNRMSVKLKELIDKMKSAQEHLIKTEKLYAIGEFSAGVAHEIKNPLTPIKMLMHTVKQDKQPLTDKDINIIEKEINRIDGILQEFLSLARPEKTEKSEVDVNEVLNEVIRITGPKMEQSAIHLIRTFSPSLPMIKGNHDALKQVFLNLILNAIQAMNGWSGRLSLESKANEKTLSVIISDTGTGITEEHMKRIFDPFFTTKHEGTGMGLALTHNIINDHFGKINIESKPGKGTTVEVILPI